jgi:L-ascorbate metabolism protein UlaG (beta-lactamase superfamily)
MRPKLVIPCHYNCPEIFTKTYNPADDGLFKADVEKTSAQCVILQMGDSVDLNNDE